ncbi:MAG: response regulator transcription factor [Actinomycetota bacterium]|nr:response regulator transcription factor [Actinomycetota bacterium]
MPTLPSPTAPVAAPARVLVVDDDETVAEIVSRYLSREGFVVESVGDGAEALASATISPPDVVVLDLMLPGLDGLEVCRRLRELAPIPVIMLTARGEESDRVMGLDLGADDYVTKPFSPRELTARVKSVLRRAQGPLAASLEGPSVLTAGDLEVEVPAREARVGGRIVNLTQREFELLVFLMRHPRQAFTRESLLKEVWGYSYGDTSTVTVHVRRLREKIEIDPSRPERIQTVWGLGYRFEL